MGGVYYFYKLQPQKFLLQISRFGANLYNLFSHLFRIFQFRPFRYLRFRVKNKRFNVLFLDFFFFKFFTIRLYLVRFRYELGSLFSYRLLKLHYLFFFLDNLFTNRGFRSASQLSTLRISWRHKHWTSFSNPRVVRFMHLSSFSIKYQRRLLAFQFSCVRRYQYRLTTFFLSLYRLTHDEIIFFLFFRLGLFLNNIFRIDQLNFTQYLLLNSLVKVNGLIISNFSYSLTAFDFVSLRIDFFFIFSFFHFSNYKFFLPTKLFKFFYQFRTKRRRFFPQQKSYRHSRKFFQLRTLKSSFGIRFIQACFRSFSFILLLFTSLFFYFFNNNFLWRFFPVFAIRSHNWKYLS